MQDRNTTRRAGALIARLVAITALAVGCGEMSSGSGGGGGGNYGGGGGSPSPGVSAGGGGGGGGGASASATPSAGGSTSAPSGAGEQLGATPGGAQDIKFARAQIEAGNIPASNSFNVEGLLSEHDIPVTGDACDSLLCSRPALGWAPSLTTGQNELWVQLGMVSGFTAPEFQRPPMDVAIVIDRSGSMSIDMLETTQAVNTIVDLLHEDDRLAVVAFNSNVEVLRQGGPPVDRAVLKTQISGLAPTGGADYMAGLAEGYAQIRKLGNDPTRMRRVIILSCGYPAVGADLINMVKEGGDERIGLSFYGVLLGLNTAMANTLSQERGGNYFFLTSHQEVAHVFDTELDYMVTPLAYDLHVDLTVPKGYELAAVYGLPGTAPGAVTTGFDVKTAFISKRKGAMVARLTRTGPIDVEATAASVSMSYTPESAHGWTDDYDDVIDLPDMSAEIGPDDTWFAGPGVRKAVALVNQVERMKAAIDIHLTDAEAALAMLDELQAYLEAEAEALEDEALLVEAQLIIALRALIAPKSD